MVSPQPKLPSSCPKLPSSLNEATVVRYLGQTCLPSSRGDSFGDYCTKTRKGTSLSFWCKVYNASVFLCSKFERDRWSQRDASRQKLLEASGRVGAILTTVASRGCPQWTWSRTALSKFGVFIVTNDIINPRAHVVTLIYIKIWTYDTWLIKYTSRLPDNLGCFVFNVNFLIVDYFYLRIRYLMKISLMILICDKMWMFKFS